MQGHDAHRVLAQALAAGAVAIQPARRDAGLAEHLVDLLAHPLVPVHHCHVAPGIALRLQGAEALEDGFDFGIEARQLQQERRWAVALRALGRDQRHRVVVGLLRAHHVLGKGVRHLQHLGGVAVVELEDGGAALGLDAQAFEAEAAAAGAVDGLGVIVENEQGVGLGRDHLHHELEPGRLEVVAFVDEHGAVLAGGNLATLHAVDDGLHHVLEELVAFRGGLVDVIGLELLGAPGMEVGDVDLVGNALGRDKALQARGQHHVVAEHEDGLAQHFGEVQAAVAQDHGLAGAGDSVDDAVAVTQAAGELLLMQVHDAHEVGQRLRGRGGGAAGRGTARCRGAGFGASDVAIEDVRLLEEAGLRRQADFREQVPADAVDLRQREHAAKAPGEHVPQALLEVLAADGLGHLVLADHPLRQQHLAEVGLIELGTGDVAEHHAVAPGKAELAGVRVALLADEGGIPL